jgi:hypothetical protein
MPMRARGRLSASRRGCCAAVVLCLALGPGGGTLCQAAETRDVLGAAHVSGKYSFSGEDFLNEGADQLLALGTRVIKVWLTLSPATSYPFHSDWGPAPRDLVELVSHPYFQALFSKPFTTYVLVVIPSVSFLDGMTHKKIVAERNRLYSLALYLLITYAGTGKTFILQNWEGDHLLHSGLAQQESPDPVRVQGMIDWWNARQDGVDRARQDAGASGVTVVHAAEVNFLAGAMEGKVTATNDVVPHTHADLYSYSSWDLHFDPHKLVKALDYLAAHAPPSALYGAQNVYLGEYGAATDQLGAGADQAQVIRDLTEAALGWGVRYAVYWQLYSNEKARAYQGRPGNDDLRPFWLIPPDGVKTPMWRYFAGQLPSAVEHGSLLGGDGHYLRTRESDGALAADAAGTGPWETFTVRDFNGGSLLRRDEVFIQGHNGRYLTAAGGDGTSGSRLAARAPSPREAQRFVIRKLGSGREIQSGDMVRFEAGSGLFLAVDPETSAVVLANRPDVFQILLQDAPVPAPPAPAVH